MTVTVGVRTWLSLFVIGSLWACLSVLWLFETSRTQDLRAVGDGAGAARLAGLGCDTWDEGTATNFVVV